MFIRQANLDAMAGRAETTLIAHSNSILRTVKFCQPSTKLRLSHHAVPCLLGTKSGWVWPVRCFTTPW